MRKTLFAPTILSALAMLATSFAGNTDPASVVGAWELKRGEYQEVLIFMDGYFTHTAYDKQKRQFIHTRGGPFDHKGKVLTVTYEFDTRDGEQVGKVVTYQVDVEDKEMEADLNAKGQDWERIDHGNTGLSGLWKITARKQGDALQPIHQSGTRKTVKILSGTRFQWAAIDPGTKGFMGTGGGTYRFENGKYTEKIEFFSRDSSRVGSSLGFDGRLENGDWHHSGMSSRGEPIYEVWSRRK